MSVVLFAVAVLAHRIEERGRVGLEVLEGGQSRPHPGLFGRKDVVRVVIGRGLDRHSQARVVRVRARTLGVDRDDGRSGRAVVAVVGKGRDLSVGIALVDDLSRVVVVGVEHRSARTRSRHARQVVVKVGIQVGGVVGVARRHVTGFARRAEVRGLADPAAGAVGVGEAHGTLPAATRSRDRRPPPAVGRGS